MPNKLHMSAKCVCVTILAGIFVIVEWVIMLIVVGQIVNVARNRQNCNIFDIVLCVCEFFEVTRTGNDFFWGILPLSLSFPCSPAAYV